MTEPVRPEDGITPKDTPSETHPTTNESFDPERYSVVGDHPMAQWWWLAPLGVFFLSGMMDWFKRVEIDFNQRIAGNRSGNLLLVAIVISAGLLLLGGHKDTLWKTIVNCRLRIILLLAFSVWAIYSHDYANKTYQTLVIKPNSLNVLCEDEDHPEGKERDITKVGGVVIKTFKGTSLYSEETLCDACCDARYGDFTDDSNGW